MNNFSFTVTICRSQEKPVIDTLFSVTFLLISGRKNNFCSTGNFYPYVPACYITIIIIITLFMPYRILASEFFLFSLFLRKIWSKHQAPYFLGLLMSFLTVFRVKKGVVAESLALIDFRLSAICLNSFVLLFSANCLRENRVWGYNKLRG